MNIWRTRFDEILVIRGREIIDSRSYRAVQFRRGRNKPKKESTTAGNQDTFVKVCNSLINSYALCNDIDNAEKIFYETLMHQKNVISINSMMTAYISCHMPERAIQIFKKYFCLD